MNARKEMRRQLLVAAARHDEFSLNQLWKETHFHYGLVSATLLIWWREGLTLRLGADGRWERGYVFSKPQGGPRAVYKWVE